MSCIGCAYTKPLICAGHHAVSSGYAKKREANCLPFQRFWGMKGEKVPRWTRGGCTFQTEGKQAQRQRNRQVCAVRGCEYFGLTGGPRAIVEVKAKASGEAESMKILNWGICLHPSFPRRPWRASKAC